VNRPERPFGLSIALILSVILFSLWPLTQVGMILLVRQHFANVAYTYQFEGQQYTEIASGGDFLGIPQTNLLAYAISSLAYLAVAVIAWRGRPPYIRWVLIAAVITLTVWRIGSVLVTLTGQASFQAGIDSADQFRSLLCVQLPFSLLIPVYVLWYVNRGPARAFFRGYYLPAPGEDNTSSA